MCYVLDIDTKAEIHTPPATGPTQRIGTTLAARALDLRPITPLLARIEAQYHPEQVWLFGSRARGDARPESDWDLFVVVPDDTRDEQLDLLFLWRLKRGSGVPADVIASGVAASRSRSSAATPLTECLRLDRSQVRPIRMSVFSSAWMTAVLIASRSRTCARLWPLADSGPTKIRRQDMGLERYPKLEGKPLFHYRIPYSDLAAAEPIAVLDDRYFMAIAIEESRNCVPEEGTPRPLVGAVLVQEGAIVAKAFRGELKGGEHAEYTLHREAAQGTKCGWLRALHYA